MSLRGKGSSGVIKQASFDVYYGDGGLGKSTIANQYPDPIYFDINDGTDRIDVKERWTSKDIPNLESLREKLTLLTKNTDGFKTVVIDSITDLDKYIVREIRQPKDDGTFKYGSVGEVPHGKGWPQLGEKTEEIVELCKTLKNKHKMNIVFLGHSKINKVKSPDEVNDYERIDLAGNDRIIPVFKASADNIFYLKTRVSTFKDEKAGRTYASTDGVRVLVTEWRPTCYCKRSSVC